MRNRIFRVVRAVRILARDGRIPRPLRLLVLIGAAPVPGQFDEIVLLIAAIPLALFYRPLLREAWVGAAVAKSPA